MVINPLIPIGARVKVEKSKIEKTALNFLIKLDRVGKDGKNLKIHK